MNSQVTGAKLNSIKLDSGRIIDTYTIIWSAGVTPSKLIADLDCQHDKHHRIKCNDHLELNGYEGSVYAVGDCASILNPNTGRPYPPTAQHALRQAKVAAHNLVNEIKGNKNTKESFDYKTKGMMAEIGKRTGVATMFGGRIKLHGFIAWWLWRTFYLSNLPTKKKKLRVMTDWTMDLFFKPDVAKIKRTKLEFDNRSNYEKESELRSPRTAISDNGLIRSTLKKANNNCADIDTKSVTCIYEIHGMCALTDGFKQLQSATIIR